MYLLQMGLQNAHVLYNKYGLPLGKNGEPGKKMSLLKFMEEAWTALIYFNPADWPSNPELKIHHAEPIVAAMPTPATPHRDNVKGSTSISTTAVSTPVTPHRNELHDDLSLTLTPMLDSPVEVTHAPMDSSILSSTSTVLTSIENRMITPSRERKADYEDRLNKKYNHVLVEIGGGNENDPNTDNKKNKQRGKCRVCSMRGTKSPNKKVIRKETIYHCVHCKKPLCGPNTGRACFYNYHNYQQYWNPKYEFVSHRINAEK